MCVEWVELKMTVQRIIEDNHPNTNESNQHVQGNIDTEKLMTQFKHTFHSNLSIPLATIHDLNPGRMVCKGNIFLIES